MVAPDCFAHSPHFSIEVLGSVGFGDNSSDPSDVVVGSSLLYCIDRSGTHSPRGLLKLTQQIMGNHPSKGANIVCTSMYIMGRRPPHHSRSKPLILLTLALFCFAMQLHNSQPLLADRSLDTAENTSSFIAKSKVQMLASPGTSTGADGGDGDAYFYVKDKCFVPGKLGLTEYRYPARTFSNNKATVVVGVLSTGNRPHERTRVRQSWAIGRTNVFFLVSGEWTKSLEVEFQKYEDMIWIAEPETYRSITVKVVVWLSAVNKHMPSAYVVKTDDDSYVRMIELEHVSKTKQYPLYIGSGCVENWVIRDPLVRFPQYLQTETIPKVCIRWRLPSVP